MTLRPSSIVEYLRNATVLYCPIVMRHGADITLPRKPHTCNNSIEENANQRGPVVKKGKYIKKSRFEELEDILKEWFENARSSKLPVSGVIL
jgi:hypothetical protein